MSRRVNVKVFRSQFSRDSWVGIVHVDGEFSFMLVDLLNVDVLVRRIVGIVCNRNLGC